VVQDVHDTGIEKAAPTIVYWPLDARNITLALRTRTAGGTDFVKQVSQSVWSVNKGVPLASVRTMQAVVGQARARTSFAVVMLGIAGAMALLLGVIGIYGVISYAVSQRRREMGIRLALGARPGELKARFVRQSMLLAGCGTVLGLFASAAL